MADDTSTDTSQPFQIATAAAPGTVMSMDQTNPSANVQKLLGKYYGNTQECVGIVQDPNLGGAVGHTSTWSPAPIATDTQMGAPIATFQNGTYNNERGVSHAARLMRRFDDGSLLVMDQANGTPAGLHVIPNTGKGGEGDASSYSVIIPKGKSMAAQSTLSDDDLINSHQQTFSPQVQPTQSAAPLTSDDQALINNHQQNFTGVNPPTAASGDEYVYIPPSKNGVVDNTPTTAQVLSQMPGNLLNAAKEGYNSTPNILGPETQGWLDKNAPIAGQAVHVLNAGAGTIGGLGQAALQEAPYQLGNAIQGPQLGRDLVGLTTAGLLSKTGSSSPTNMITKSPNAVKPLPGKLISSDIPNQPLTPAMQPGATPAIVSQEAILRSQFPKEFKPIDAQVDASNVAHLQDTLDGVLNEPTKKILFNTDSKSPKFDQSLMSSDGKSIDPGKFDAWYSNLKDSLKTTNVNGGLPPVSADSTRFYHGGTDPTSGGPRWVSSNINYAKGWSKKSDSPVSYVDIPNDHPSLIPNSVDAAGKAVPGSGFGNFEAPADVIANMKEVPPNVLNPPVVGPKFGGIKGKPNFDPATLSALDNINDSISKLNQLKNMASNITPDQVSKVGVGPMTNFFAQHGSAPTNPFLGLGAGGLVSAGELMTHGIPAIGPGIYGATQLYNKGMRLGNMVAGPRAATANQSELQRLLSQTINPPPPQYQLGSIISNPTASP